MKKMIAAVLTVMLVGLFAADRGVKAAYDTATVSTPNEFLNALEDSYIKKISLENNITIDQKYQYIQMAGGKSINGNGFSLTFDHNEFKTGYGFYLSNLKDSLFRVSSVGEMTVDQVENSEVSVSNFTNTYTVKNSSLQHSQLNNAETIVIKNSTLTDSPVRSTLSPLVISDSTFYSSPITVTNSGNIFERITVQAEKETPFVMSNGSATVKDSTFITQEAGSDLSINRGTLTLEGQTTVQGATQSAISLNTGLVYVKGNIHQVGDAYTIKANRENLFTTQVFDLYGQLKKSQDSNLNSYYNTSDRDGVEPVLPDEEKYVPTPLKDVTFLKQDYNEVTVLADNPDILLMIMDGNGNFYKTRPDRMNECSIILPNQPIGSTVYVYAMTPDGNQSKVQKFLIDRNATVPLYVSSIYDTDTAVTGKTSPDSNVFLQKEGTVIAETKADQDGFFKLVTNPLALGTQVQIYAVDPRGNKSVLLTKVVDSPLIYADDMNSQYEITGTLTSNTPVQAYVKGKPIGTFSTQSLKGMIKTESLGTRFKLKIPLLPAGTPVEVTGYQGDRKIKRIVRVKDLTPPVVPTISPVDDNDLVIKGKTEAYATVTLYINKKYQKTVASKKDGSFSFAISKQKAGTEIKVTAADKAKNTSVKTTKVLDRTPPAVPSVSKVTAKTKYVTGKAELNSTVYIYKGKLKLGSHRVDRKGRFSIKIKTLKKGTVLTVYAKDQAGNKSKGKLIRVY